MDKPQKKISHQTYLMALGLFTLAQSHYRKLREAELALGELLGSADDHGYSGVISDELYERDGTLDKALKLEGYVVEDDHA